jgi:hypothetical protein
MMPLDFDGLKKQRFRWCLGGIQILRLHWRDLVPLAPHRLRLTPAQRIHYLLGALQWFGDLVTACFTLLLIATAITTSLHHELPLRRLTGAVLAVPLAFAATGVARAVWAMRATTGCTLGDAVRALRCWFALSWVVTLACVRGLWTSKAEFLRTPKRREGEGALRKALMASRMETAVAAVAVITAVAMMARAPSTATVLLGVLLLFEAFVYVSAPWASIAAENVALTPERRIWSRSSQNTGERPVLRAVAAGGAAGAVAAAAAAAALVAVLNSPPGQAPFSGGGAGNLPPLGRLTSVPVIGGPQPAAPGATPSPSGSSSPSPLPPSSPSSSHGSTPASTPRATRGATSTPGSSTPGASTPAASASSSPARGSSSATPSTSAPPSPSPAATPGTTPAATPPPSGAPTPTP